MAAAILAVAAASTARADVFEIGKDGAMRTRSPGAAVAWSAAVATGEDAGDDDTVVAAGPDVPGNALTTIDAPEAPAQFSAALADAARRYDVSPSLLAALVWQESRWQPAALSNKGAIGLAQLMPATARALAVDPHDAASNLAGAAHYLRQLLDLFDGDVERALAAYNAGPGRVLKANGVPAIRETQTYVATIIDRLARNAPAASMGDSR